MCFVSSIVPLCSRYYVFVSLCLLSIWSEPISGQSKVQISAEVPDADFLSLPRVKHEGWSDPCFYFSMEMIMEAWKNSTANINYGKGSNSLLSLFIHKFFSSPHSWSDKDAGKIRHPFINIEANSYQKRDEVAKRVSRSLKGQFLTNPPKCMEKVAYIYTMAHDMHRPFSAIGQWASSHAAKAYWVRKPVVMTGYWYHHTAATVADLVTEGVPLPPANSSALRLPADLIAPDLTVFLDSIGSLDDSWEEPSGEDKRALPQWRDRFTRTFDSFPQSDIIKMKWTNESSVTNSILELIKNRLGTQFKINIK